MSRGRAVVSAVAAAALIALPCAPQAAAPASATPPPKRLSAPCLPARPDAVGGERLRLPGVQVRRPAAVPPPPAVKAAAWIVTDLDSGAVLASADGHKRCAPASTLKILTAITLAPRLDPGTVYIATATDQNIDGSKVGVVAGSQYTVRDLLHGLLLGSGNDTASGLAALAGGLPEASRLMQAEAARLGGDDTVVANTSGLDAEGQVTSPYDLALFGRQALRTPSVASIVATKRYRFPAAGRVGDPRRATFEVGNHNKLLYGYAGATGVKNGYTVAAGGSFVGSARRSGRGYLVALIHADGQTAQMARQLLDWAFTYGSEVTPVGRLVEPGERPAPTPTPSPSASPALVGGTTAAGVTAAPAARPHRVPWPWVALTLVVATGLGGALGWWRYRPAWPPSIRRRPPGRPRH
ncbi:MAG: serine hydrolase [Kineosporiaceae bacterium]